MEGSKARKGASDQHSFQEEAVFDLGALPCFSTLPFPHTPPSHSTPSSVSPWTTKKNQKRQAKS